MDNFLFLLYDALNSNVSQVILRLLLSVCFGALIGIEREHAHRPAGLRTHILVCMGACLIMLVSEFTYAKYHQFSPNMDINRLGAQVISGIGFLGAGTIIHNGDSIKGLTTAASIWAVACVGLATGIGFYLGAAAATIIIFIVLSYIRVFSKAYDTKKIFLSVISTSSESALEIEKKLFSNSIDVVNISLKTDENDKSHMIFGLCMNSSINPTSAISEVYTLPGIVSVNINEKNIFNYEE